VFGLTVPLLFTTWNTNRNQYMSLASSSIPNKKSFSHSMRASG